MQDAIGPLRRRSFLFRLLVLRLPWVASATFIAAPCRPLNQTQTTPHQLNTYHPPHHTRPAIFRWLFSSLETSQGFPAPLASRPWWKGSRSAAPEAHDLRLSLPPLGAERPGRLAPRTSVGHHQPPEGSVLASRAAHPALRQLLRHGRRCLRWGAAAWVGVLGGRAVVRSA